MDVLNNNAEQVRMEQIADDVSRYSILVGFLLIIIFVAPCVAFALLSKYCQKPSPEQKVSKAVSRLYVGSVGMLEVWPLQCHTALVNKYVFSFR